MSILVQESGREPAEPAYEVARASYSRCLSAPDFFATLYAALLAADPAIPPLFERTEFPKQHKLLQHGLGLLLSYARAQDDQLLDRIAARHGPEGIDVKPGMYRHFEHALLEAVRRHDPRATPAVEDAWRAAVRPGIELMKRRHGA